MDAKLSAWRPGSESLGSIKVLHLVTAALLVVSSQACAPRRTFPQSAMSPRVQPAPHPSPFELSQSPRRPEPESGPALEEARIEEENLGERRSGAGPMVQEEGSQGAPRPQMAPPVTDENSLIAKITPGTSPRRAASLRLTEEGKKLLEAGEYAKGLARLERTISLDSTNPYGYFYLAKAHYHMGRYRDSLNFLDVSESLLGDDSYWLGEVFALRGENFRTLGFLYRAETNYAKALQLNPENRVASEWLARLRGEIPPSPR